MVILLCHVSFQGGKLIKHTYYCAFKKKQCETRKVDRVPRMSNPSSNLWPRNWIDSTMDHHPTHLETPCVFCCFFAHAFRTGIFLQFSLVKIFWNAHHYTHSKPNQTSWGVHPSQRLIENMSSSNESGTMVDGYVFQSEPLSKQKDLYVLYMFELKIHTIPEDAI